jgi:hypothetical protein
MPKVQNSNLCTLQACTRGVSMWLWYIIHVSNMYPTYINRIIHVSHICITHVSVRIRVDLGIAYHACISAYQKRFQKAYVSCVYLHVSRVSGMVCIWIHVSFMYLCVSACITHCVSHNVSSVLYRMYPVYIVNLYHNGWKCQKMRIFFWYTHDTCMIHTWYALIHTAVNQFFLSTGGVSSFISHVSTCITKTHPVSVSIHDTHDTHDTTLIRTWYTLIHDGYINDTEYRKRSVFVQERKCIPLTSSYWRMLYRPGNSYSRTVDWGEVCIRQVWALFWALLSCESALYTW